MPNFLIHGPVNCINIVYSSPYALITSMYFKGSILSKIKVFLLLQVILIFSSIKIHTWKKDLK